MRSPHTEASPPIMTVTALNIASPQPTGQTGVGAGANAGDAGPLAGFEALLSALFPQVDPAGATGMTAANANPLAADGDAAVDGEATADDAEAAVDPAAPTAGDAAVALAASLMVAQPAAEAAPVTTAKAPDAPVSGKDKTKGVPAFPAQQAANPRAGLAEQAELAAEAADAGVDAAAGAEAFAEPMTPPLGDETANRAQAAPQQQARNPAAAPAPAAAPVAQPEPTPTAVVDTPVESATPASETAVEAQADVLPRTDSLTTPAPAAATTNRSTKTERAKAVDDASAASDEAPPSDAVDKPLAAKAAATAATRPAGTVEERDVALKDTKATVDEADASDTLVQGETRAAAQAATPTAHAASSVRGGAETVANLAAQVVKKLGEKTTRFDVQLDPHGLGKVDVRIEIGAHGRITAGMTFENPQAAADVKARASELQKALEQAGFDISGGISFDVAQDQGQRQQQNNAWQDQGDAGRAFQGRAFRAALETAGDAADAANQGALRLRRGVNSGVDVRI